MNKQEILNVYIKYLDEKIKQTQKVLDSIHRSINTAPTPSESHSDTTRSQQSRVALEISNRLSFLKRTRASASAMRNMKSVSFGVGTLVVLRDSSGEKEYYFVVFSEGGESFFMGDVKITFISLNAPILEPITKTEIGDNFEFMGRKLTLLELL